MTEKPVSPIVVANYMLKKGTDLDPLKLMKLVYMCHGWYLAVYKKPLVNEEPQAGRYGPMFADLYSKVAKFGDSPVRGPIEVDEDTALSDQQKWAIHTTYDASKVFTGWQLSEMTHRDGTPWHKVWLKKPDQNAPIPNKLIKQHYKEKVVDE